MEAETVIIADDDAMVRSVMKSIFKLLYPRVRVVEASNGDDAIEQLGPDVVCIIADVLMPKRDGIEMCRVIRSSAACAPYRDVPVIIVSALHSPDELAHRAWNAGTAFFLRKPFGVEDLIRAVTSATNLAPTQPSPGAPAGQPPAPRALGKHGA